MDTYKDALDLAMEEENYFPGQGNRNAAKAYESEQLPNLYGVGNYHARSQSLQIPSGLHNRKISPLVSPQKPAPESPFGIPDNSMYKNFLKA